MTDRNKALIWAAIIITTALFTSSMELSNGANFGIIAGLSGAAWGSLNHNKSCRRSCAR